MSAATTTQAPDDEEDDWELNIGTITIRRDECVSDAIKDKIVPAKLSVTPIAIFPPPPDVVLNGAIHPMSGAHAQASSNKAPEVDEIDPTLLEAIGNPRAKMHCLGLEDMMMRFCCSSSLNFEIPPQQTSFQRLIVFKLAERFNLDHKGYGVDNEMFFQKTSQTKVPKTLLIDSLKEIESLQSPTQSQAAEVVQASTKAPPKVMQRSIMQNKTSSTSTSDSELSRQNGSSADDLEKQYAEARARIFKDEEEARAVKEKSSSDVAFSEASHGSGTTTMDDPAIVKSAEGISAIEISSAPEDIQLKNVVAKDVKRESIVKDNRKDTSNNHRGQQKGGGKSVMRDKNAERYDPDFARHRGNQHNAIYPLPQQFNPSMPYVVYPMYPMPPMAYPQEMYPPYDYGFSMQQQQQPQQPQQPQHLAPSLAPNPHTHVPPMGMGYTNQQVQPSSRGGAPWYPSRPTADSVPGAVVKKKGT